MYLDTGKTCLLIDIYTHRTHLLWIRLYSRKSYIFSSLLLLYAYIYLFVYSYETLFYYYDILHNFYIAGITRTI